MSKYGHISLSRLTIFFLAFLAVKAPATTYYVDINSANPVPPYTSWATAATNIQDAINAAVDGNLIMVRPGVYQTGGETVNGYGLTNRVAITGPLIVESTEGPTNTIIQGYEAGPTNGSGSVRCVYMTNNAVLIGFTLRGGGTLFSGDATHEESGGGVWCETTNATVFNCVIAGNTSEYAGGGAVQGTLQYCTVSQNAVNGGITYGGGAYDSDLADCIVLSNTISGNNAYGAGVYSSDVTNSVIADNMAVHFALLNSYGGGAEGGNLDHCNIIGNLAADGGGTYDANLVNCINCFNTGFQPGSSNFDGGTITYTCTAPTPGNSGDISGDPLLASMSHISLSSPCRGAGIASAADSEDIDNNPWGSPPSIGCFEPHPGNVLGGVTMTISTQFTNWAPGYSLNFQANISGPVYSNVWNFGDGTFATNEIYTSHIWSAAGNYPVKLTAYSDQYPAGIMMTLMINIAVPSVYYVNLDGFGAVPPYMTWNTAAANIQDAVNVAAPGSLVLVTNGPTFPIYNEPITNSAAFYWAGGATAPDGNFYRVVITNAITVESVNGPATTYIWGETPDGNQAGCAYLTAGATLSGFTITNSAQDLYGSQISATSTNAFITNCVITHDININSGTLENCSLVDFCGSTKGALNSCIISNNCQVLGGVLNNCILVDNTNSNSGQGGAATAGQGYPLVLNNCIISNNVAQSGYGGGVYNTLQGTPNYYTNCILNNCTLAQNSARIECGGAYGAELNNCLISSNSAPSVGGVEGGFLNNCILIGNSNGAVSGSAISPSGAVLTNCSLIGNVGGGAYQCTLSQCTLSQNVGRTEGGAYSCILNNCLIISNINSSPVLGGGGAYLCQLTNCVLANNVAGSGGGAYQSTLVNCTVAANTALRTGGGGGIYESTAQNCILDYNTNGDFSPNMTQYPLNYCCAPVRPVSGSGNITNAPLFVNLAANDFHLQANSPCINSANNAYIPTTTLDLDDNPRISGGTVDIGGYEFQNPASSVSYAYLQQYGLPMDGSVDSADLDGTAFDVYQDWVAGLNPTNPASVLAMVAPNATNNAAGITVSWRSVSGILYNLQRSTNLSVQPAAFTMVQTNINGQTGITRYTDTSATNSLPYFYRVNVLAP
ncbi:MAG TPA: choice-of-anchor Q domain-containing protein [Verrucomicrobiae bacterium]|jgi:hypothetical protein|nr:choice-of-anchor Q domain-containing protein [Verrucomicrobiae bacterium]